MNMLKIQIASLKQLFRNKEAIFWSVVFPLIFIMVFRLFNFSGSVNARIIIIDEANNPTSQAITTTLQNVDGVGIHNETQDIEHAKNYLENSQHIQFTFLDKDSKEEIKKSEETNVVLIFPKNYGQGNPAKIIYNESDEGQASPSKIVESIIREINYNIVISQAGIVNPYEIVREGVTVNEISYYDTLVPGIIGMGIMQSGIIGMAANIASYKEKRILKRLSGTPLPIWKFLLCEINSFLILNLIQIFLMVVLAKFMLGANIYGSIPLMFMIALGGSFVFLSFGFIAASLTKTANAATGFANALTTPMMFLSGVFFSREGLPSAIQVFADYLPLSPIIDALREIALKNASILDIKIEILIILLWTLGAFLVASKVFKFREE